MSRIRAAAVATALGAFLLAGVGTAAADDGVGALQSDANLAHTVSYPFVLY
ncbi:hypothetical protein [Kitasatospora phosalacinea]|uniref:hypothetical protein n=1 Tax=Kitasatospora phosalacinea TaxID=2065 RepID=UPI000B008782|nr:hypothetical protein [Kitasatospora phosalacinea]